MLVMVVHTTRKRVGSDQMDEKAIALNVLSSHLMTLSLKHNAIKKIFEELSLDRITPEQALDRADSVCMGG